MNEGIILSRFFFFRSIHLRKNILVRFKKKKKKGRERKKEDLYFRKLRNDGSNEDDLYRVEIWKDGSKHGEIRIWNLDTIDGTRRSIRINMSGIKDGLDESREARVSVSKFDRNAILWSGKWVEIHRVAETVELFLSPLPPPQTMKRKKSNRSFRRCYSSIIEFEASSSRHIERSVRNLSNLVSRENDSHFLFLANVLFADESDQFLFGGIKTSVH